MPPSFLAFCNNVEVVYGEGRVLIFSPNDSILIHDDPRDVPILVYAYELWRRSLDRIRILYI